MLYSVPNRLKLQLSPSLRKELEDFEKTLDCKDIDERLYCLRMKLREE